MPFLELSNFNLYYQTYGDASETIVLLHGLGSASDDWALQLPALTPCYRVVTVDLRGHRRSAYDRGFSIALMADDVATLLTQLQIQRAHVLGMSMGGCVAQMVAIQHPTRVLSLTLVNTFAKYRPRQRGRALQRVWLLATAPVPKLAEWVARGLFPKPEQALLYQAAVASISQNSKWRYFNTMRAIATFDVRAELPRITCPTLVISGERDTTVPFTCQEELKQRIPNATLHVIADSGHATPMDQYEEFNQIVLGFLAQNL